MAHIAMRFICARALRLAHTYFAIIKISRWPELRSGESAIRH